MITENLSTLKIHKLTQAQYDRELANGTLDPNAIYLTPDEEIDLSIYATIEQLKVLENYILSIDYDKLLAFDTDEIVIDGGATSPILGVGMLGYMVLA